MQVGSIPPTYCGSFLHTLIFPYRGSPQQVERPHSQRRNSCKLILPGQIAGLRPRRIIARHVTAIVSFVCPMASTDLDSTSRAQPVVHPKTIDWFASPIAEASARFSIPASWIRAVIKIESGGERSGRCLRPALYSSLRSSPSHPTGVSALRVTIAIANARFARKQWGFASQLPKSRRLFRNESATSRRVRAGAIG